MSTQRTTWPDALGLAVAAAVTAAERIRHPEIWLAGLDVDWSWFSVEMAASLYIVPGFVAGVRPMLHSAAVRLP